MAPKGFEPDPPGTAAHSRSTSTLSAQELPACPPNEDMVLSVGFPQGLRSHSTPSPTSRRYRPKATDTQDLGGAKAPGKSQSAASGAQRTQMLVPLENTSVVVMPRAAKGGQTPRQRGRDSLSKDTGDGEKKKREFQSWRYES